MSNISFDNVYLLFLIIPLVVIIALPFAIAIRKDNVNGHNIASCVIHLVIALLVCFAIAGTTVTTVVTQTEVYVVADVSYSANRNLDTVDRYIQNVQSALPANSKMGVYVFGRECQLLSGLGEDVPSVKSADFDYVDDSATDISNALSVAASNFSAGSIKRIVLITDGKQTSSAGGDLTGTINALYNNHIYVDAIYLNDNIDESTPELQISSVDYSGSAFVGRQSQATVSIRSSSLRNATIYMDVVNEESGEESTRRLLSPELSMGLNVYTFDLDTSVAGTFRYTIRVESEYNDDLNTYNDSYSFSQTVTPMMRVCFVFQQAGITAEDGKLSYNQERETILNLYGEIYGVDVSDYRNLGDLGACYLLSRQDVPTIVEDLCGYDQIVLVNVDLSTLNSRSAFVNALEILVSDYGKSLLTFGDLGIRGSENDSAISDLQNMLPVNYGNSRNQDKRHIVFVIDNSRSLLNAGHLSAAKTAVNTMISNLLSEEDDITIVAFWGEVQSRTFYANSYADTEARDADIQTYLDTLTGKHGTDIGAGLRLAQERIQTLANDNSQIFLLSDGLGYSNADVDPVDKASELYSLGYPTTCIYLGDRADNGGAAGITNMKNIAAAGRGYAEEVTNYYECAGNDDINDVILSDLAPVYEETEIVGRTSVDINLPNDYAITGGGDNAVTSVPDVTGYFFTTSKTGAANVLTVSYTNAANVTTEVPIYSWWNYGNGKVASVTSSILDGWMQDWTGEEGKAILKNIIFDNTPEQHTDYPYTVGYSYVDGTASLELLPSHISLTANASVEITAPGGDTVSGSMAFNSQTYTFDFVPEEAGVYTITFRYSANNYDNTATVYLSVPYLSEYDAFTYYSASTLNRLLSGRGTVSEDGTIEIVNPESEISTYSLSLTLPLFITAVALFVVDIIIRKLKWNDIKSLFVKIGK